MKMEGNGNKKNHPWVVTFASVQWYLNIYPLPLSFICISFDIGWMFNNPLWASAMWLLVYLFICSSEIYLEEKALWRGCREFVCADSPRGYLRAIHWKLYRHETSGCATVFFFNHYLCVGKGVWPLSATDKGCSPLLHFCIRTPTLGGRLYLNR